MPFPMEVIDLLLNARETEPQLLKPETIAQFIMSLYDRGRVYLTASPEDSEQTVH